MHNVDLQIQIIRKEQQNLKNSYLSKCEITMKNILDPEKSPSSEDLDILQAAEQARQVFDKNLIIKFAPAIRELEELGYPGIADPKLTIATKMVMGETLKHDAAVQYTLSRSDTTLKLPEKYNGLGYQNLISMVFDLMRFRDDWMHEGKAETDKENFRFGD